MCVRAVHVPTPQALTATCRGGRSRSILLSGKRCCSGTKTTRRYFTCAARTHPGACTRSGSATGCEQTPMLANAQNRLHHRRSGSGGRWTICGEEDPRCLCCDAAPLGLLGRSGRSDLALERTVATTTGVIIARYSVNFERGRPALQVPPANRWPRSRDTGEPVMTCSTAHALARCSQAGRCRNREPGASREVVAQCVE